ncbi:MAG: four helix bundle protein [Candidatus Omnitrophica bacterium]|nr:four helix bundle protein [Candidatus Omnitrophota bacterium]
MVYRKSLDYVDFVYQVSSKFPSEERFGLASQFQRAAQSIALNIGEGSGGSKTEFKQFLRIARRSVRECVVCTAIARRREFMTSQEEATSRERCAEISKMLSGLLGSLD